MANVAAVNMVRNAIQQTVRQPLQLLVAKTVRPVNVVRFNMPVAKHAGRSQVANGANVRKRRHVQESVDDFVPRRAPKRKFQTWDRLSTCPSRTVFCCNKETGGFLNRPIPPVFDSIRPSRCHLKWLSTRWSFAW